MNSFLEAFSLERYLPPVPTRIVADWIASNHLNDRFVLDPFGAAPDLCALAAQGGTRLIVAANNPISRLLIEVAADPPTLEETHSILSTLAATRIRDERLELHISALYLTICPHCLKNIQADAFIWDSETFEPISRLIHCPHCAANGEFPITESDLRRAAKFTSGGLHHARALERVAPINDPDRIHVEGALSVYPPRAVYSLLTIINKLDALNLSDHQEKILGVMLLHAFDMGNTLWSHPVARERPRQLTIPPLYRENNIWLALENATNLWSKNYQALSVTHWPELPSSDGGICLFEGRIKDLVEQLEEINLAAVLMAFPRPNQAYWALSALWAGWLWGHSAVTHFKNVLRRRRYDWGWHTAAIHAALASLRPALQGKTRILGLVGEAEPGFMGAALIAAFLADLNLDGINLHAKEKQAQIYWDIEAVRGQISGTKPELSGLIQHAARKYLLERGEPCNYLQLHAAILKDLAQNHQFPATETPAECYNQTQQAIQNTLSYQRDFLRFGGSEKSLEVGQWWLTASEKAATPLADRVEVAVAQYLIHNPGCFLKDVENTIYQEFSGLLTPAKDLIIECLESYGYEDDGHWQLREIDTPSRRRDDIISMQILISKLGTKLGFKIHTSEIDPSACIWLDIHDQPKYAFHISASAILGKFLLQQNPFPGKGLVVIPGGRANLAMFKLHRDPRFRQIVEHSWQFVKYRQIRQLADSSILTVENLEAQLGLDPLTYTETQLRMF